jgi:hypothetical protein
MYEYGRALGRAMLQEFHDARIIEIFFSNVITDLDAEVSIVHAAVKFGASEVSVLQGNLAKRLQPAFGALAHLERNIVKQARAIQSVLCLAGVGKKDRRGGNNLHVNAVAVHVFETHVHVPARGSNVPEHAVAQHDVGFAWPGVFD